MSELALTRAGCSTDAMHVVFGTSRNVVINDKIDKRNVETSAQQHHNKLAVN